MISGVISAFRAMLRRPKKKVVLHFKMLCIFSHLLEKQPPNACVSDPVQMKFNPLLN